MIVNKIIIVNKFITQHFEIFDFISKLYIKEYIAFNIIKLTYIKYKTFNNKIKNESYNLNIIFFEIFIIVSVASVSLNIINF